MEIPYTAVKKKEDFHVAVPNIPVSFFIKFDVETEVTFTFKESIDRFWTFLHEPWPYLINSVWELFIFRRFSLIQLLILSSVFSITIPVSLTWLIHYEMMF